jgi:hypothetical protein
MRHRTPDRDPERDKRTGTSAAAARVQHQTRWVDLQIQQAMERGDFDDLPGFGKPIAGLGHDHDPDWWVKKLVEREQITGVLPPALQVRKDDAELDDRLDRISAEQEVRREVEEFNARVRKAMYQPLGGPPMITRQRDIEVEVEAWRARRAERRAAQAQQLAELRAERRRSRRWFGRRGAD